MRRHLTALTLLLIVPLLAPAVPPEEPKGEVYEGTVVMAIAGKLTMLAMDGKTERTHEIAMDAKISREGHECRLEDLRKGERITITMVKRENKEVVVKIDVAKSPA